MLLHYRQDDVSRLLIDDPNSFQYGSFSDQNMNAQTDPLESQRENEAVQKVVAKTSKYVAILGASREVHSFDGFGFAADKPSPVTW